MIFKVNNCRIVGCRIFHVEDDFIHHFRSLKRVYSQRLGEELQDPLYCRSIENSAGIWYFHTKDEVLFCRLHNIELEGPYFKIVPSNELEDILIYHKDVKSMGMFRLHPDVNIIP